MLIKKTIIFRTKMSHIQLPHGLFNDNKKQLRSAYQGIMNQKFYFFSYCSQLILEIQVFKVRLKIIINNREDLQKYLLATGDLNDSIQESLDLVVTVGHLNDATV